MGHDLSGDVPEGRFPRFAGFPVLAWSLGVGEMLAIPRFEWISADGVDDSAPFLDDRDLSQLPAWLVCDRDDEAWLRVPTWIDPVWFAKEAAAPLRALAKLDAIPRKGRPNISLAFGYRLMATELDAAIAVVDRELSMAGTGPLVASPPQGLTPDALADWQSVHVAAELAALDRRGAAHLRLLVYAIGYLQSAKSGYVYIEDDPTAFTLAEFTRRRFFRTSGSRADARASLNEWTLDLFGSLESNDLDLADEELRTCVACANGLAEASGAIAAVYLASAKLHALRGTIAQAHADLAWADHMNEGSYAEPYDEIAENVRGAVELVHSLSDRI